jgi:hypothetical protein
MSIYVYGITRSTAETSGVKGLRDTDVYLVAAGLLAALCSDVKEGSLVPGEEDLWTHERVLEEAQKQAPVLPARFGTVLVDEETVTRALQERREAFEDRLRDLDGKVEIGIRALRLSDGGGSTPVPADGHAYMMNKLEQQKRSDSAGESARSMWGRLHEALEGSFGDYRMKLTPSPSVAFSAAYLVDQEAVDRFTEIVANEEVPDEIELFVTGPWPPYSFAEPGAGES